MFRVGQRVRTNRGASSIELFRLDASGYDIPVGTTGTVDHISYHAIGVLWDRDQNLYGLEIRAR